MAVANNNNNNDNNQWWLRKSVIKIKMNLFWSFCVVLLLAVCVSIFCTSSPFLPPRSEIWQKLISQGLPTPIFASDAELFDLLKTYGISKLQ